MIRQHMTLLKSPGKNTVLIKSRMWEQRDFFLFLSFRFILYFKCLSIYVVIWDFVVKTKKNSNKNRERAKIFGVLRWLRKFRRRSGDLHINANRLNKQHFVFSSLLSFALLFFHALFLSFSVSKIEPKIKVLELDDTRSFDQHANQTDIYHMLL